MLEDIEEGVKTGLKVEHIESLCTALDDKEQTSDNP